MLTVYMKPEMLNRRWWCVRKVLSVCMHGQAPAYPAKFYLGRQEIELRVICRWYKYIARCEADAKALRFLDGSGGVIASVN